MAHSQMSQQERNELLNSVVYFDLDELADSINKANQARANGQPNTIVLDMFLSAAAQQQHAQRKRAAAQQQHAQRKHGSKKACSDPTNR